MRLAYQSLGVGIGMHPHAVSVAWFFFFGLVLRWVEGLTPVSCTQGGAAELWMAFGYRAVRAPRQTWSHKTGCCDPRMRHICWNSSHSLQTEAELACGRSVRPMPGESEGRDLSVVGESQVQF